MSAYNDIEQAIAATFVRREPTAPAQAPTSTQPAPLAPAAAAAGVRHLYMELNREGKSQFIIYTTPHAERAARLYSALKFLVGKGVVARQPYAAQFMDHLRGERPCTNPMVLMHYALMGEQGREDDVFETRNHFVFNPVGQKQFAKRFLCYAASYDNK